ncbi:MAG: carbohydrate porin [Alphaproteobacteria bacterium]|nr:MAG: carbohydrate porin [Alphaproteobacteria bacterium]
MNKFASVTLAALLSSVVAGRAPAADAVEGSLTYTAEIWQNARGGVRHGSAYLDNLDLTLAVDADAAFGLADTEFFFYGLYNNNNSFTEAIVGDAQTVSNIDTGRAFRLYEAWVQHRFADGRASVKAGLYDLNSEFDAKEVADIFIGSSHGIGPDWSQTGENGPSIFPTTSLALRADYQLSDTLLVRTVVLDAVPNDPDHPARMAIKLHDGALVAVELDATETALGRFAAGTWAYSKKSDPLLADDEARRNKGAYAFWEATLIDGDNGVPSLAAYARIGFADGRLNQFSRSWQGALRFGGLVPGRPDDETGLAVSRAVNSSSFREAEALLGNAEARHETVFELTHRMPIADWLTLQPDLQYIVNPSAQAHLKDALALGLRAEISVNF